MSASESAVSTVGSLLENILSVSTSACAWNGVRVDVTEFHYSGRAVHRRDHEGQTRLNVVLEEIGGRVEPRPREN